MRKRLLALAAAAAVILSTTALSVPVSAQQADPAQTAAPTDPADPSTGVPSTGVPSTGVPSTGEPSTGVPSTGEPSTGVPSTGEPSTGVPSTGEPSTGVPSTDVPSTGEPSTGVPSTGDPSTGVPSTGDPATGVPPTSQPSTPPDTDTPSKPSGGGSVITDDDLQPPDTPDDKPQDDETDDDPPQTSSDASAELPEGVSVEITEVTLYSDGKGSLTLALHNSAYVTYVISAVTVNTTAGDTIVTLSHEFSYGTSELEVDFAGVSGDVSGVTLVLAQKDAQDAYSGEVKIAVSEATQVYKRQAWTTARILRTAGFALLGLIVLERIVLAIVLFCNYKRDGMRRVWPWFVFLGGLWVFILYFVVISQFGISGDEYDPNADFKDADELPEDGQDGEDREEDGGGEDEAAPRRRRRQP